MSSYEETIIVKNGKHVILCVDDDRDYLSVLEVLISAGDYIVETACSGEDGLKKYRTVSPDLLLVDLMMEEIDSGLHLVKEIRALGDKVPVFMLSSVGDNLHISTDYASLGLSGVLQKPVDRDVLLSTLRAKLRK